ncbi:MAG: hypothetical protein JXR05_17480 [Flavobacteriaceae bacterium]
MFKLIKAYLRLRKARKEFEKVKQDPKKPYEFVDINFNKDSDLRKLQLEDLNENLVGIKGTIQLFGKPMTDFATESEITEIYFDKDKRSAFIGIDNSFYLEINEPRNIFLNDSFFNMLHCNWIKIRRPNKIEEADFDSNYLCFGMNIK